MMWNDGVTTGERDDEPNPHHEIAFHDVERRSEDGVENQIPRRGTRLMIKSDGEVGEPNPKEMRAHPMMGDTEPRPQES